MLKLGKNPVCHEGIKALCDFIATAKNVKSIITNWEECSGIFDSEESGYAFRGLKSVGKSTYF
jgi:hypothetical protein